MYLSTIVITSLLQAFFLFQISESTSIGGLPRKFSDDCLPPGQRDGQFVEHLGRLIKLKTIFSHKDVKSLLTRFSIHNRGRSVENITFTPDLYCDESKCAGPYQYDLDRLRKSGFDPKLKTVILISGFLSEDRVEWLEDSRDVWLEMQDVNVILVTWRDGNRYIYDYAVANTPLVARQITILLHYLAELNGYQLTDLEFLNKIHIVGHSLGAHIAGFVGQDVGGKLGRVTGLDPAGPSFDEHPPKMKLDRGDALLVDVIHTNAGKLKYGNAIVSGLLKSFDKTIRSIPLIGNKIPDLKNFTDTDTAWFGIDQQAGDIDYYANNGRVQPGCEDFIHICDHGRSHEIYLDLLKYYQKLQKYPTTKMYPEQHRLLAFQSQNFKDFSTGTNLNEYGCGFILSSQSNISKSVKSCSVPFDPISHAKDLVAELKNYYGVDLAQRRRAPYYQGHKYYFTTNPSSPFLGDQYLLKLRVRQGTFVWNKSCSLKTNIIMANGKVRSIKITDQIELLDDGLFYGIAFPFVSPNNIEARDSINHILLSVPSGTLNGTSNLIRDSNIKDNIEVAVPIMVHFEITSEQSSSFFNRFISRVGSKSSNNCKLIFEEVTIEPLINQKREFVVNYSNSPNYKLYDELNTAVVGSGPAYRIDSLIIR